MKSILFLFGLLIIAGCESDIDKCVEAQKTQMCTAEMQKLYGDFPKRTISYPDLVLKTYNCKSHVEANYGGDLRVGCLKAQSGK